MSHAPFLPQISQASPLGPFCNYVDFDIPENDDVGLRKGVFLTRSEQIHYNLYDTNNPRPGPIDPNYFSWKVENLNLWGDGTGYSRSRKYNFSLRSVDTLGEPLRQNRLTQIQFGFCNVSSVDISLRGDVEIADPRFDRLRVEIYKPQNYESLEPFAVNRNDSSLGYFGQPISGELSDDWFQLFVFGYYKSYEVATPMLTVMIESEQDTPEYLHTEEVETITRSNSINLDVNDPCGYIMRITSETGDPNWNLNVQHEAIIDFITSSDTNTSN